MISDSHGTIGVAMGNCRVTVALGCKEGSSDEQNEFDHSEELRKSCDTNELYATRFYSFQTFEDCEMQSGLKKRKGKTAEGLMSG